MKLVDTIVISLATGFFIIGVHQAFYYGIAASYWLFMLSLLLVFYLKMNKKKPSEEEGQKNKKVKETRKATRYKAKK